MPFTPASIPDGLRLFEAVTVLYRVDERLDHLGAAVVAAELFELREPEVVAGEVRVRPRVRVAPEETEVLHQHEGAVRLAPLERLLLGEPLEDEGARRSGAHRLERLTRRLKVFG